MEETLNVYSIRDLENFSGIKAHTIRIWEKRYSILEPDRTDSNIRMYTESELKKSLNVAFLNRNGLKISKIAALDDDQLTGKVMDVSSKNDDPDNEFQPGKLLMSALRFNETQFTDALLPYLRRYGAEEAYINFFHPLLTKASILWQTGSLSRSQEQFIRNCIRQIMILEDCRIQQSSSGNKDAVVMINTSENMNDNNFLFYRYVMKKRGYDVIFTGGILPPTEIYEISRIRPFKYLVVSAGTFDFAKKKVEFFSSAGKALSLKKVIFTDYPGSTEKRLPEKIIISRGPGDFVKKLSLLK